MLKNILNLEGVQGLSKTEQKTINGGFPSAAGHPFPGSPGVGTPGPNTPPRPDGCSGTNICNYGGECRPCAT